jgi:hypothetical protein
MQAITFKEKFENKCSKLGHTKINKYFYSANMVCDLRDNVKT